MTYELITIKVIIATVGFIILIKPRLLMSIQDRFNTISGVPPMSSRVRPIFVQLAGVVVIIIAMAF